MGNALPQPYPPKQSPQPWQITYAEKEPNSRCWDLWCNATAQECAERVCPLYSMANDTSMLRAVHKWGRTPQLPALSLSSDEGLAAIIIATSAGAVCTVYKAGWWPPLPKLSLSSIWCVAPCSVFAASIVQSRLEELNSEDLESASGMFDDDRLMRQQSLWHSKWSMDAHVQMQSPNNMKNTKPAGMAIENRDSLCSNCITGSYT